MAAITDPATLAACEFVRRHYAELGIMAPKQFSPEEQHALAVLTAYIRETQQPISNTKFGRREQNASYSPDITWGEGSVYGHITIHGWSSQDDAISALAHAASAAIADRIIAFLNASEPSEAELVYEVALDAKEGR